MRILIVDDNERIRRGVSGILSSEPDWQVCGEASDGMDGIAKARELQPDLVLLDVSMPGMDGLETARLFRQEKLTAKILILSQHDPTHLLPGALEAGAQGCVDKSRLITDLVLAIKALALEPTS
jgi:DNA-binding NarL/FixJ family response regulator